MHSEKDPDQRLKDTAPEQAHSRRISLMVTNEGSNTVYLGDSTVTAGPTGNGTPLEPAEKISFDISL